MIVVVCAKQLNNKKKKKRMRRTITIKEKASTRNAMNKYDNWFVLLRLINTKTKIRHETNEYVEKESSNKVKWKKKSKVGGYDFYLT